MTYNVEVLKAKSGINTLKINNQYIHSSYDPIKEAERLAQQKYVPHQAHIIFGYGCGYLVNAVASFRKYNEIIIVVEPLLEREEIIVEELPSNTIIFGKDVLDNFEFYLSEFTVDYRIAYNVICLTKYDNLFPKDYKLLLSKVKDVQMKNQINDITSIYFSKDWQKNFLENIYHLSNDLSLNELRNRYSAPVVIASGGPSLNKQLSILKKYRNQIILIAAGSTINSLLKAEIEPDYVVSIDGGIPNYNHFKSLKLEKTQLIYTMQNHPGVREAFQREGFAVDLKGHPLFSKYIREKLNVNLPLFEGGGTVAHIAFSVAQFITSGPIALIGQDLAYTNNESHAAANAGSRELTEAYLEKKRAFKTEAFHGGEVWTTPVFYSMKLEFEDLIKIKYPENEFFNCTEGGLALQGYKQLSFSKFCEKFACTQVNVVETTNKKLVKYNASQILSGELSIYDNLDSLLVNAIQLLKGNKSNQFFEQKVLKKLDDIDKKLNEYFKQLPIESLLAPITLKVMGNYLAEIGETKEEEFNRVKNQSLDFYKNLREAIVFAKENTKEIINKHMENEG